MRLLFYLHVQFEKHNSRGNQACDLINQKHLRHRLIANRVDYVGRPMQIHSFVKQRIVVVIVNNHSLVFLNVCFDKTLNIKDKAEEF